jgi:hypothetical protein
MGRCPALSGRIDFAVRRHGIRRTLSLLTRCLAFIALAAWTVRPASAADVSGATVKLAVPDESATPPSGSDGSIPAASNEAALRSPYPSWESSSRPAKSDMNLWRASVAALAVTNIMDVKSSWGKRELNPALAGSGGTFGARGALLKAGIVGGAVALQFLILRHGPSKSLCRALAAINFGGAGLVGSSAVRNWRVADR